MLLFSAFMQTTASDSLKSLDLGDFEITQIREIHSPAELGIEQVEEGRAIKLVVCVEVAAKSGRDTRVKMNIALPLTENWNGIYLARGNGGLGNSTQPATPYPDALLGYATSHNDLGTEGWQSARDLKPIIADFGHRAIYNTAVVSKKIIAAYYGQDIRHVYYSGGSTGGQMGLSLAERHPELFDGIAVLYPVTNRTRLHTRFAYERKVLDAKDYFTTEEIEKISDAIVAQNRTNPGEYSEKDYPFLKYPERATCDYAKLTFLSDEQIAVLKRIHDTVKNAKGEQVTIGLYPSAELADNGKSLLKGFTGDWVYPMALGDAYSVPDVNFDDDFKRIEALFAADANALPNLDQFKKLGKKLLIIQGKLDTVVPPQYVKDYYDTLTERNGGLEQTRTFARIFYVPGMWHGNAVGCNPLSYLRGWIEKGDAPQTIDIGVRYKGNVYQQTIDVY